MTYLKLSALIVLVLGVGACSALNPGSSAPTTAPTATTAAPATAVPTAPSAPTDAPAASLPAWQTIPLVDARTGETFTLSDFAGKTVYVEPMATWCTNCRQQMRNLRDAIVTLGTDEYVYIALSVETNISASTLASYADNQGFDWTFAVLSPEALIALTDAFGRTISNPPSTPHFVIRPDLTVGDLQAGRIKSAEELVDELTAASGA